MESILQINYGIDLLIIFCMLGHFCVLLKIKYNYESTKLTQMNEKIYSQVWYLWVMPGAYHKGEHLKGVLLGQAHVSSSVTRKSSFKTLTPDPLFQTKIRQHWLSLRIHQLETEGRMSSSWFQVFPLRRCFEENFLPPKPVAGFNNTSFYWNSRLDRIS